LVRLAEQVLQGNARAIARQITGLENNQPEALSVLAELYPHAGKAYLIGLTGPPGSGKSTLVNQIAKAYRQAGQTVAILSIDPSSPFSGGALLGDRIRLSELAGDTGVFVRSMATRGSLGGLARAAANTTVVFDAAGFDLILVETVGAGQVEVEIAGLAHSVIVVETPGAGDDVQAIKAGVLEIADVFVVNKADQPGADRTAASLAMMLDLAGKGGSRLELHHGALLEVTLPPAAGPDPESWRPPICRTVATTGEGIEAVLEALARHRYHLASSGLLKKQEYQRLARQVEQALQERLLAQLLRRLPAGQVDQVLEQVAGRQLDPYSAADLLLKNGAGLNQDQEEQDE
jgi:LAO/AO transport system kinase